MKKEIKWSTFREWILKQSNNKKIDMNQSCSIDGCGCLMVQYGKHLNIKKYFRCTGTSFVGSGGFEILKMLDYDSKRFVSKAFLFDVKNFKQAKQVIADCGF